MHGFRFRLNRGTSLEPVFPVFRALGIPCRCVTGYVAGRDPDSSLILEKLHKDDDDAAKMKIWNFHVWNEVWMRRDDLIDSSYGGWQAVDSASGKGTDRNVPRQLFYNNKLNSCKVYNKPTFLNGQDSL